jgi:hypothetical protein
MTLQLTWHGRDPPGVKVTRCDICGAPSAHCQPLVFVQTRNTIVIYWFCWRCLKTQVEAMYRADLRRSFGPLEARK